MKIVVDENIPLAEELFGAHAEVIRCVGRSISQRELVDVQALIVRSVTLVDRSLLSNTDIEFVGSCTAGFDHIDAEFMAKAGIDWNYAPGCNARSVAEYVSSVLAALDTLEPGKRAGIIGCGHVGRAVYDELSNFGMEVVAYDPFLKGEEEPRTLTTLEDAMSSDIVCLHTPYTDDGPFPTAGMIGEAELNRLQTNAILISAGRGGVLDEQAMYSAAKARPDIRWVMDVWSGEPQINPASLELASIATPHIAGYSLEGKQNGSWQVYQHFCEHFGFSPKQRKEAPGERSERDSASIGETLLGVYDPRSDDERMRKAFIEATKEERKIGSWFDSLRRDYPQRRECFTSNCIRP